MFTTTGVSRCCCEKEPEPGECPCCDAGTLPDTFEFSFTASDILGNPCQVCTQLNGTWVLSNSAVTCFPGPPQIPFQSICLWTKTISPPIQEQGPPPPACEFVGWNLTLTCEILPRQTKVVTYHLSLIGLASRSTVDYLLQVPDLDPTNNPFAGVCRQQGFDFDAVDCMATRVLPFHSQEIRGNGQPDCTWPGSVTVVPKQNP